MVWFSWDGDCHCQSDVACTNRYRYVAAVHGGCGKWGICVAVRVLSSVAPLERIDTCGTMVRMAAAMSRLSAPSNFSICMSLLGTPSDTACACLVHSSLCVATVLSAPCSTPVPSQPGPLPGCEVVGRRARCSLRCHAQNAMTRCITQNTARLPMA